MPGGDLNAKNSSHLLVTEFTSRVCYGKYMCMISVELCHLSDMHLLFCYHVFSDLNLVIWNSCISMGASRNPLYLCPISLSVCRMTYTSGRGTTASTISTPRRTQTPTMPRGGSSSPTLVGWWFANIPTSLKRAKNWSCRTWRQIQWWCSRDGEQTSPRVCFGGLTAVVLAKCVPQLLSLQALLKLAGFTSSGTSLLFHSNHVSCAAILH